MCFLWRISATYTKANWGRYRLMPSNLNFDRNRFSFFSTECYFWSLHMTLSSPWCSQAWIIQVNPRQFQDFFKCGKVKRKLKSEGRDEETARDRHRKSLGCSLKMEEEAVGWRMRHPPSDDGDEKGADSVLETPEEEQARSKLLTQRESFAFYDI